MVTDLARRHSDLGPCSQLCSLASVVLRISSGLAAWTLFPDVVGSDLRGGAVTAVYALNTLSAAPVSAPENHVFVSRLTDTIVATNTFSILAFAVNGCGSVVITDALAGDPRDCTPKVAGVDAADFPGTCVDALRVLSVNFSAAGAEDQFAVALVLGLHRVLSVVSHTDEGGVIRDIFRRCELSPPFGCIHTGLAEYTGIPALMSNNVSHVSSYMDAIALATAAAVAHCDPGVAHNGEWFPSLLVGTSPDDTLMEPGETLMPTDAHARNNRSKLATIFPRFSSEYVHMVSKMFGFVSSEPDSVAWLDIMCMSLTDDNRFLSFPSVSPFLWNEPTSLIPYDYGNTAAEIRCFASKATVMKPRSLPAFEDIRGPLTNELVFSEHYAKMRTARTSAYLAHFLGHQDNGLGAIVPLQMDPNLIIQPGSHSVHRLVRDRLTNSLPVSDYLWTRGQSPFPVPGELYNLGCYFGFRARHISIDYGSGAHQPEHIPRSDECSSCTVSFFVSNPIGLDNGTSNYSNSDARRARTRASDNLSLLLLS
ncbi:hypothetical protein LTR66_005531 [Elasticomyces elasticus]|nr:hypothetical protein LTR66_005531 [Elasticomyces elasticus]